MQNVKFIATAMRKNVDGKADYRWVFCHVNDRPVLFESEEEALACAISKCADPSYGMYFPKSEKYANKG